MLQPLVTNMTLVVLENPKTRGWAGIRFGWLAASILLFLSTIPPWPRTFGKVCVSPAGERWHCRTVPGTPADLGFDVLEKSSCQDSALGCSGGCVGRKALTALPVDVLNKPACVRQALQSQLWSVWGTWKAEAMPWPRVGRRLTYNNVKCVEKNVFDQLA